MSQTDQQNTDNQRVRRLIARIYVIFMNYLAASNIFMMIYHFGIRGLEFAHYATMVFGTIVAIACWTIWPKRRIAYKPFDSIKPMSKQDADTLNSLY